MTELGQGEVVETRRTVFQCPLPPWQQGRTLKLLLPDGAVPIGVQYMHTSPTLHVVAAQGSPLRAQAYAYVVDSDEAESPDTVPGNAAFVGTFYDCGKTVHLFELWGNGDTLPAPMMKDETPLVRLDA